jgi:putative protease
MLVREKWPQVPIHLSVQANVVNYATVDFWQKLGIARIILSRELSLEEIAEIRQRCPDIELEVFVHGALCIAYSGRCLLSGYMRHRDSNQGACTNSCRWRYQLHQGERSDSGDIIPAVGGDPVFLLQEQERPGELMPVYEDEHGTYIMNSKDLRAVQHVQRLQQMGIESVKIEGRTKSHYYVARTTQIYRQAIEDARVGNDFSLALMDKLESLANRGYTEGFYRRHVRDELQNYERGTSKSDLQRFVGEVVSGESDERSLLIDVKNRFSVGDRLELMSPRGSVDFTLDAMESEKEGAVSRAPGSGHRVRIRNPGIQPDYGLLIRYLPEKDAE